MLILGETGTGKGLLANAIHHASPRAAGPFVKINCAGIPAELLESELFGHKRGSFTGAVRDRVGLLESGHAGTVFLDEIGDLAAIVQAKLLDFLQEQTIKRVGENIVRRVNTRIIAATNHDLAADVAAKQFRRDLFYRLDVARLELPPLRDRLEDIPALTEHFLRELSLAVGGHQYRLTPAALAFLGRYDWPGNIRQLEHALDRAVILSPTDEVGPKSFLTLLRAGGTACSTPRACEGCARDYLGRLLELAGGDLPTVLDLLGLGQPTSCP